MEQQKNNLDDLLGMASSLEGLASQLSSGLNTIMNNLPPEQKQMVIDQLGQDPIKQVNDAIAKVNEGVGKIRNFDYGNNNSGK